MPETRKKYQLILSAPGTVAPYPARALPDVISAILAAPPRRSGPSRADRAPVRPTYRPALYAAAVPHESSATRHGSDPLPHRAAGLPARCGLVPGATVEEVQQGRVILGCGVSGGGLVLGLGSHRRQPVVVVDRPGQPGGQQLFGFGLDQETANAVFDHLRDRTD